VEELGFQLLDRRDVTLWQGGTVKHWSSGVVCRVAGYSFLPLSGESGALAL
jgi:hypothetical protein